MNVRHFTDADVDEGDTMFKFLSYLEKNIRIMVFNDIVMYLC